MLHIINLIKISNIFISIFGYFYCIKQNKKYHTLSEFAQIHDKIYMILLIVIKFMFLFSVFLNIFNLRNYYTILTTFGSVLTLIKLNTSKLIHYIGFKIFILTPIIQHYDDNKIVSLSLIILLVLFLILLYNTSSKIMKRLTLTVEFTIIMLVMINY